MHKRKREEKEKKEEKQQKKLTQERKYHLMNEKLANFYLTFDAEEKKIMTTAETVCKALPVLLDNILQNLDMGNNEIKIPHFPLEVVDLVFYIETFQWKEEKEKAASASENYRMLKSYSDSFLIQLWEFEHEYQCKETEKIRREEIVARINEIKQEFNENHFTSVVLYYTKADQFKDVVVKKTI